jgi:hypothetical protein
MKERPILFSGEMVRAILAGRKTQTRRVIKPQPELRTGVWGGPYLASTKKNHKVGSGDQSCPYGEPGARLWVRETWRTVKTYDHLKPSDIPMGDAGRWPVVWTKTSFLYSDYIEKYVGKWRRSIFMPRWASRITLEVTDVRVERVQSITRNDAKAEGVSNRWHWGPDRDPNLFLRGTLNPYVANFSVLWDSINSKRGYGWDVNPWVWVVVFQKAEG